MVFNPKKFVPPTVAFGQQVGTFDFSDLRGELNGTITADSTGNSLGVMKQAGKIRQVAFMTSQGDQEGSEELSVEVDVLINGVSCLDTKPKIAYGTGESSEQRSTLVSGEFDGVTVAVLDNDARTFTRNDRITYDVDVTRTSPITEIAGLGVLVEIEPILPT